LSEGQAKIEEARRDEQALADQYDEAYYAERLGEPYRWDNRAWQAQFGRVADVIVRDLAPRTVLDVGCGFGFLVKALRDRGVEAYGIDVSHYALEQVPEEIAPYCDLGSITDELDRNYDLVVCIEVVEHLPPELAESAVASLTSRTDNVLFSSTPSDLEEPTHVNVRPIDYWAELFARRGFFRDFELDATVVAPHAIHFVRTGASAASVARAYERERWMHQEELHGLRQALDAAVRAQRRAEDAERRAEDAERSVATALELERSRAEAAEAELARWRVWEQRGGYRIFMALASVRARLAPTGTMRDRLARRALAGTATALERVTGARRPAAVAPSTPAHKAVLILSGCPGDAKRYRGDHQVEQLAQLGVTSDTAFHGEVDLMDAVDRYECFVLHRVPWGADVETFVAAARARGKPLIFDTDDLVFDPAMARHVAALESMDESERLLYVNGLTRYRETLRACDAAMVSTEPLRERASALLDRVLVVPNAVSDEMVAAGDHAAELRRRRRLDDSVTMGYFSGTPTHDRDFLEASDPVLWVLDRFPQTRLLLVGPLTVDERFERFAGRVERVPFQPWQQLPELLARVDINLAPLERDNPFTESKSCLKYIEAGLVGVPTIASARSDFRRAIRPGENGLLVDTPAEWKEALRRLVESAELREQIGRRAYDDVRAVHTTRASATACHAALAELSRPQTSAPLTINWIVRAPIAQTGGGYRNIFGIARELASRGHVVRLYVERIAHLESLSRGTVRRYVEQHFEPTGVEIVVDHDEVAPADASIATNWPTAAVVDQHRESLFKLYYIQDFEPEFYDDGDPLARLAEQTYELPLRHVCFGKQMAAWIAGKTGKPADYVDFPLDDVFATRAAPEARPQPITVLFFARPGLKRRGFELGIESLRRLLAARPDVNIELFGTRTEELGELPFPARNLGVLAPEELAGALNRVHILLSFSLTNMSRVAFEGMACGAAVVEIATAGVEHLVTPEEHCLTAAPKPEAVVDALVRLVDDDALRCRIARAGAEHAAGHSWERIGGQFEEILLRSCFARLGGTR
jgi:glycosyltransferase involved in cell wall biosynthesis/SAM-dependent methyltransferase